MKHGKSKYCKKDGTSYQAGGSISDIGGIGNIVGEYKEAQDPQCPLGYYYDGITNKCVPMSPKVGPGPIDQQTNVPPIAEAEKSEQESGVPIWTHLLYGANILGRQLSETTMGNRRGSYWQNNAANPYSGILGTNDGQSDSSKYGTVEYQDGGQVPEEEESQSNDFDAYEFLYDEEDSKSQDNSAYQSLYDMGMPNISDYNNDKDNFENDLEEWKVKFLSEKETADPADESHRQAMDLFNNFINYKNNPAAPITASTPGTLEGIISEKESGGNYKAFNPAGGGQGAIGKYQFRWKIHKDWISKLTGVDNIEDFKNSPEAQEKAFQHWKLNVLIPTAQYLLPIAEKRFPGITLNEIASKVHFLGESGAKEYYRTGKSNIVDANGTTAETYAQGGLVSKLGYRYYSPFIDEPQLNIETENGLIDMRETNFDVKATQGDKEVIMKANHPSPYQFNPGTVREERMQQGGRIPIYTNNPKDPRLQAYNDSLSLYNNRTKSAYDLLKNTSNVTLGAELSPTHKKLGYSNPVEHYRVEEQPYKDTNPFTYNVPHPRYLNGNFQPSKDLLKEKIKPIGYQEFKLDDTMDQFPIYKKPVQPIVYQQEKPSIIPMKDAAGNIQTSKKDYNEHGKIGYKPDIIKTKDKDGNTSNEFIYRKKPQQSRPTYQDRKPIITDNPNDPRLRAYNDSLKLSKMTEDGTKVLFNPNTKSVEAAQYINKLTGDIDPAMHRLQKLNGTFPEYDDMSQRKGFPDSRGSSIGVPVWRKPVQPIIYRPKKLQENKPTYQDSLTLSKTKSYLPVKSNDPFIQSEIDDIIKNNRVYGPDLFDNSKNREAAKRLSKTGDEYDIKPIWNKVGDRYVQTFKKPAGTPKPQDPILKRRPGYNPQLIGQEPGTPQIVAHSRSGVDVRDISNLPYRVEYHDGTQMTHQDFIDEKSGTEFQNSLRARSFGIPGGTRGYYNGKMQAGGQIQDNLQRPPMVDQKFIDELNASNRLKQSMYKQAAVAPAKQLSIQEQEKIKTLKRNFVNANPYSKLDEQGNIVPTQYDRAVTGVPDKGSPADKMKKGLNVAYDGLEAASYVVPAIEGINVVGKMVGKYLAERSARKKMVDELAGRIKAGIVQEWKNSNGSISTIEKLGQIPQHPSGKDFPNKISHQQGYVPPTNDPTLMAKLVDDESTSDMMRKFERLLKSTQEVPGAKDISQGVFGPLENLPAFIKSQYKERIISDELSKRYGIGKQATKEISRIPGFKKLDSPFENLETPRSDYYANNNIIGKYDAHTQYGYANFDEKQLNDEFIKAMNKHAKNYDLFKLSLPKNRRGGSIKPINKNPYK